MSIFVNKCAENVFDCIWKESQLQMWQVQVYVFRFESAKTPKTNLLYSKSKSDDGSCDEPIRHWTMSKTPSQSIWKLRKNELSNIVQKRKSTNGFKSQNDFRLVGILLVRLSSFLILVIMKKHFVDLLCAISKFLIANQSACTRKC